LGRGMVGERIGVGVVWRKMGLNVGWQKRIIVMHPPSTRYTCETHEIVIEKS
jgi:hypothetical protein